MGGHCLGWWPMLLWQWPELGSEANMPQMEKADSAGAQGWALLWGFSIYSALNLYWGESISFTTVFTQHVGLGLLLMSLTVTHP